MSKKRFHASLQTEIDRLVKKNKVLKSEMMFAQKEFDIHQARIYELLALMPQQKDADNTTAGETL